MKRYPLPKAYVEELAAKYNTRYLNRTFTTTYGSQITIDASRGIDEIFEVVKGSLEGKI